MFDAHCHLHFDAFDADRDQVLKDAQALGLRGLVLAGYDQAGRAGSLELVAAHPGIVFATAGLHPWALPREVEDPDAWLDQALDTLRQDLENAEFCALGECGLDYVRATTAPARDFHKRVFIAQLKLAYALDLPLVLHVVKAYHDLLWCLDHAPGAGGMIHSYSGPVELIEPLVSRGWSLSFGTDLVRHEVGKAHSALQAVAASWPERWMVETDAPDRPIPGKTRGEPGDVRVVLEHAATLLDTSFAKLADQTEDNARQALQLPPRGDGP